MKNDTRITDAYLKIVMGSSKPRKSRRIIKEQVENGWPKCALVYFYMWDPEQMFNEEYDGSYEDFCKYLDDSLIPFMTKFDICYVDHVYGDRGDMSADRMVAHVKSAEEFRELVSHDDEFIFQNSIAEEDSCADGMIEGYESVPDDELFSWLSERNDNEFAEAHLHIKVLDENDDSNEEIKMTCSEYCEDMKTQAQELAADKYEDDDEDDDEDDEDYDNQSNEGVNCCGRRKPYKFNPNEDVF